MIPKTTNEERAVSPVIGVILMVAITVILAAVIGAFVLGLGDDLGQEVNAGASISSDGDTATITWTSEGSAESLTIHADPETGIDIGEGTGERGTDTIQSVGGTVNFTTIGTGGGEVTITVIAERGDQETVVQSKTVSLAGQPA